MKVLNEVLLYLCVFWLGFGLGNSVADQRAKQTNTYAEYTESLGPILCPIEFTDRGGTRWAPPYWSDPECRAIILWNAPR